MIGFYKLGILLIHFSTILRHSLNQHLHEDSANKQNMIINSYKEYNFGERNFKLY